jgi:hypothetical protein
VRRRAAARDGHCARSQLKSDCHLRRRRATSPVLGGEETIEQHERRETAVISIMPASEDA